MATGVTDRINGIPVLSPEGAVDITNSSDLRDSMVAEVEGGQRAMVLDLSLVRYIDSSGLSALVHVATALEKQLGHLVLASIDPAVLKVLEMTRLTEYFVIVDSREEGLARAAELLTA